MGDLLSYNNIITNPSALNQSLLSRVNKIRKMRFEAISLGFGNNFVNNIAKTNRAIIHRDLRHKFLRNQSNVSITNVRW